MAARVCERLLLLMVVTTLVPSCTDESPPPEPYLGLAVPKDGFQVRTVGADIAPGEDAEYCEVGELPGDPGRTYIVNLIEMANARWSHHLFVNAAVPGSPVDAKLRAMNIGDRVPCLSGGSSFPEAGLEAVFGIQQAYGKVEFPKGVGREYFGRQRLLFDYHYLNTSSETVSARSALNFHVTEASRVQHLGKVFGFYNWTIDTPAGKSAGFTAECPFRRDVKVGGLTRHTHRWGTDFSVWFAGGDRAGEEIWKSSHWEEDVELVFSSPMLLKAGEGFRFRCDYNNTESHPLRFGSSARDEMCVLFGLVWDAGSARTIPSQNCDVTWTDGEGIGRPAAPGAPLPAPSAEEVAACRFGSTQPDGGLSTCADCRCNACATSIVKCALDPDCSPILLCVQRTNCGRNCGTLCQDVIDEHSSAVGLITQAASCIDMKCPACSLQGGGDAGAGDGAAPADGAAAGDGADGNGGDAADGGDSADGGGVDADAGDDAEGGVHD
jgi:hypothetical protein